jgi:hypothetical protein
LTYFYFIIKRKMRSAEQKELRRQFSSNCMQSQTAGKSKNQTNSKKHKAKNKKAEPKLNQTSTTTTSTSSSSSSNSNSSSSEKDSTSFFTDEGATELRADDAGDDADSGGERAAGRGVFDNCTHELAVLLR